VDRRRPARAARETDVSALEPTRQVVSSIAGPPFKAEIEISGLVPPCPAAEDDPLIVVTRQAAIETGRSGDLSADLATDDSTWLGNAGISTILCGPGEPEQAHTVDERIDVADIRDAIGIYASL
jgi:acetylornithine deacetylase/succinyl-diaminopimelate desuccinylase-like protein